MTVVDWSRVDGSMEIEVTRKIKVGGRYRIAPSDGMEGIEEGAIVIQRLLSDSEVPELDEWDEVGHLIGAHKGAYLDGLEGNECADLEFFLSVTPWVVYSYIHGDNEVNVLPLEDFLYHTLG